LNEPTDSSGQMKSHWWVSTISFTLIMHLITYKLLLQTSFWHVYGVYLFLFWSSSSYNNTYRASAFVALIFYYITVLIMSVDSIAKLIQPQINGILPNILGSLKVLFFFLSVSKIKIGMDYHFGSSDGGDGT